MNRFKNGFKPDVKPLFPMESGNLWAVTAYALKSGMVT